jgi:hypothetical protein
LALLPSSGAEPNTIISVGTATFSIMNYEYFVYFIIDNVTEK